MEGWGIALEKQECSIAEGEDVRYGQSARKLHGIEVEKKNLGIIYSDKYHYTLRC